MDKELKNEFKKVNEAIEGLAAMTAKGFEQVDKHFEQIEGTIGNMQGDIDQLSVRLSSVGHEVAEIHKHLVYRDEFDDLMGRMKYVEIKLGIESGK
ncbi:MAG: hypothetical protein A3D67_02480 [Candidatus Lloydbacteria bacterium RIFCSPHIGHO2_02_FULL_51_22]|uniref:t-SNARE coiled-coil homology domain-containing protein n=2 Tax=Candidatus Lloydiibacteriota TaxID=1817910 RepID=A0A1G2DEV6_9BACT|nr:MAG: hypothetical protein A3D67_02480 [Candidatus Lloydbacteria bacterium RIFCSPHIGHO2_02_FULL_51_22]OGZ15901.1 MAG: hypothetical protein A3G11_02285 [Candidatus Lloydbacteria bacterium RIFCSPLOWO2_12_FULL_51_9]